MLEASGEGCAGRVCRIHRGERVHGNDGKQQGVVWCSFVRTSRRCKGEERDDSENLLPVPVAVPPVHSSDVAANRIGDSTRSVMLV